MAKRRFSFEEMGVIDRLRETVARARREGRRLTPEETVIPGEMQSSSDDMFANAGVKPEDLPEMPDELQRLILDGFKTGSIPVKIGGDWKNRN